jgi:hypothetical protein
MRVAVICIAILAVFSVMNLVYHVLRKPTEVFSPVSSDFNKTPVETWRQYAPLFQEYSTGSIPPSCWPHWRRWRAPAIRSRAPIGGGV